MLLIESLQNPALYNHSIIEFEVIETHISWVLLTGNYVYKIKKPLNFGFLDFSTLEKRRFYCEEELRLNRQLAPDLYIGVVTIHGSEEHPEFNGQGAAIEYAVKMQQFPQSTQLDRLLTKKGIDNVIMDKLASKVANFHLSIAPVKADSDFGDLNHVRDPILENFKQIRACTNDSATVSQLEKLNKLENWSKQTLERLAELIQKRKAMRFVRECHGDMHLRNIALWNDDIIIFDCIEFNKNFYLIDVMSEIAFLIMDLEYRHQETLAYRFLNSYLEITGDYEGLKLLQLYKVYRALVRAKVEALRLGQEQAESQEYQQTFKEFMQYINLAEKNIHQTSPCLLINHGLSGAGKSTITRALLEKHPAIQLRSDVERKRLFKLAEKIKSTTAIEKGIYTTEATQKTYARLLDIAQYLLSAGYSVVIDATNLKFQQRQPFIELAKSRHVAYFILTYKASEKTLIERVEQRIQQDDDISDATLETLQHQIANYEPLTDEETTFTIEIDTERNIDIEGIVSYIRTNNIKVK